MFDAFPTLKTARLTLRALTPADAESIFAMFSDDEVTRYYDTESYRSLDEASKFIEFMTNRYAQRTGIRWAITGNGDGQCIGTCGLNGIQWHRGVIGYDLARAYWGRGYAPEAVGAMTNYLLTSAGLHRVQAMVIPGNTASVRVLEKLGFSLEGTLRAWGHFKGRYWDMMSYSRLGSDSP